MSKTRSIYCVLSLFVILGAWLFHGTLSSAEWINQFSFWCGLATLVALVVAIGETVNSGTTQSQIRNAIDGYASEQGRVTSGSVISEAIALLDESGTKVQSQDYQSALRLVQIARRFLVRVDSHLFTKDATALSINELFNAAEKKMQAASHSTLSAPLTPRQRLTISTIVCDIKSQIESIERIGVTK